MILISTKPEHLISVDCGFRDCCPVDPLRCVASQRYSQIPRSKSYPEGHQHPRGSDCEERDDIVKILTSYNISSPVTVTKLQVEKLSLSYRPQVCRLFQFGDMPPQQRDIEEICHLCIMHAQRPISRKRRRCFELCRLSGRGRRVCNLRRTFSR